MGKGDTTTEVRQSSFGKGEVAPAMYGRTDYQGYASGLRRCRNMLIDQHGAALNRPGTRYVAEVKDSTQKVRLVPFVFSGSVSFVLEFGNNYIRFYQNGGQVQSPPGTPVEVATTYATADLMRLKFTQVGDVITICHPNYAPNDLKRLNSAGTSWSLTNTLVSTPPASVLAVMVGFAVVGGSGAVETQYAVTAVYADGSESLPLYTPAGLLLQPGTATTALTVTWNLQPGQARPVLFNIYKGRAGTVGLYDSLPVLTAATTFNYSDTGQSQTNFSTPPPTWARPFPGTPTAWATSTQYLPGVLVTANGNTYKSVSKTYGVSLSTGTGPSIGSGATTDGAAAWIASHAYIAGDRAYFNGGTCVCTIGGTSATGFPSTLPPSVGGTFTDGSVTWQLVAIGQAIQWQFVQAGTATVQYPAVVAYFDQRRVFANTFGAPNRFVGSQVGNFNSFDAAAVPKASDGIDFQLDSQRYEEIRSFLPLRVLLALTSEKDWAITGGAGQDSPITPNSILARPNNVRGASWLDPIVTGNTGLYVQALGTQIWELNFDFYTQSYLGKDVTVTASHLFENHTIVDWAYAQVPFSIVWAVREDGRLLGLSYLKEEEILAWHWHDTGALDGNGYGTHTFENVCSVPEVAVDGSQDFVYVVVRRVKGDGTTHRYIERFASRLIPRLPTGGVDTTKGWFLDAALQYSGAPATVFSGLGHLEGLQVNVLADGNVFGPYTVTGGVVDTTADNPDGAALVTIGLPFLPQIELLDAYMAGGRSIRSDVKSNYRATIEVADSRGLWVSNTYSNFKEWVQRNVSDGYLAVKAFTGVQTIRIPGTYELTGRLIVEQLDPLPLTLLAVQREFDLGES